MNNNYWKLYDKLWEDKYLNTKYYIIEPFDNTYVTVISKKSGQQKVVFKDDYEESLKKYIRKQKLKKLLS